MLDALHYCALLDDSRSMPPDPRKWRPPGRTAKCALLFTDAEYQEVLRYIPGNLEREDVELALTSSRIRLTIVAPDYPCYNVLAECNGVEYIRCGNYEDYAKLHSRLSDPTQQEKDKHQKVFEKIIRDFAATVSATAMEDA